MLEKAFTVQTLSAAAAAFTDDKCRSFSNFIATKLRIYLLHPRNIVQYEISNIIFAAYQGPFDVSCPFPPSPASQVSSPTTPSSAAGSENVILRDLMCL
jgi:hypothetical protein